MQYRVQNKKQDSLKIVLFCKVANYKDIQKILLFLFLKLAEYDWEQEDNEEQEV